MLADGQPREDGGIWPSRRRAFRPATRIGDRAKGRKGTERRSFCPVALLLLGCSPPRGCASHLAKTFRFVCEISPDFSRIAPMNHEGKHKKSRTRAELVTGKTDFGYMPKLLTSERTTSSQPSIRTKSSNFSGREIVIGGIIIMPMLMRTVATTRSIKMNGTKIRKPI